MGIDYLLPAGCRLHSLELEEVLVGNEDSVHDEASVVHKQGYLEHIGSLTLFLLKHHFEEVRDHENLLPLDQHLLPEIQGQRRVLTQYSLPIFQKLLEP